MLACDYIEITSDDTQQDEQKGEIAQGELPAMPSCIPSADHVFLRTSKKPNEETCERYKVEYDEAECTWFVRSLSTIQYAAFRLNVCFFSHRVSTVFPALKPCSTDDVLMLDRWLSSKASSVLNSCDGASPAMDQLQILFDQCVHELVRQVSNQCVEAGDLLSRVWRSNAELLRAQERRIVRDMSLWKVDVEQRMHEIQKNNQVVDQMLCASVSAHISHLTERSEKADSENKVRCCNLTCLDHLL